MKKTNHFSFNPLSKRFSVLALCFSLGACSLITPYKMPIQQGNQLNEADLARIELGLTKAQVKSILGTPLLSDPFHPDRWDYVYQSKKSLKKQEKQTLNLYFKNNILSNIEKGEFIEP
jgi:outer membrane protein assembly factor BamE